MSFPISLCVEEENSAAIEIKKKFPVGIEFFGEFMTEDFYYVDKGGIRVMTTESRKRLDSKV